VVRDIVGLYTFHFVTKVQCGLTKGSIKVSLQRLDVGHINCYKY